MRFVSARTVLISLLMLVAVSVGACRTGVGPTTSPNATTSPTATFPPVATLAVNTTETEATFPPIDPNQPAPPDVPPDAPHCSWSDLAQIAYELPGMVETVEVTCGIVYKEIRGLEATLDLYLPVGIDDSARVPLVVFFHGNEDLPELHPIQTHWKRIEYTRGLLAATMGMAAVAMDYRGYDDDEPETLAGANQDGLDLLSYVGAHADELRIDPTRICVWGTSGGGYPATWAAIFGDPQPVCAVMFSAGLDAQRFGPEQNPVEFINPDMPPFFIARGLADGYSSPGTFVDRATAMGVPVILEEHPGGHGFENDNDSDQQRIVGLALEFLADHLQSD